MPSDSLKTGAAMGSYEGRRGRQQAASIVKYQPLSLERYISLGSLAFPSQTSENLPSEASEAEKSPLLYLTTKEILANHLHALYVNGWIRVFIFRHEGFEYATMRVFLLPDDTGRATIPRNDPKLRYSLRLVMEHIDCSSEAWNGYPDEKTSRRYEAVCTEHDSLFYIFNTLQPPRPDPSTVQDSHASIAMDDILNDSNEYLGLKTSLYEYQKRSAAIMIQREAQPSLKLDSRLEVLKDPSEHEFYFDRVACQVFSEGRSYEDTRGGILAEMMGHGKTLISLAVILATKGHLPQVPLQYQPGFKIRSIVRDSVGASSLKSMLAATIYKHNIPWRTYFGDLAKQGYHAGTCVKFMEENTGSYSIPEVPRSRRVLPVNENRVWLSSTTLIVVPSNLIAHWKSEIRIHLEPNALSCLVFVDDNQDLPDVQAIIKHDVLLMSKTRFQDEFGPRRPGGGKIKQNTMQAICTCDRRRRSCLMHEYSTCLTEVHFLRFIVDEGHSFASSNQGTRASAGLKQTHAERKWVISGTPSRGMIGLEIDLATDETVEGQETKTSGEQQEQILQRRKTRPRIEIERKELSALGHVVTDFLELRPWANAKSDADSASWNSYLAPNQNGERKAGNLRSVLASLIVRHPINEIEKDLKLPSLSNRVVYLDPCYWDKLSLNLFVTLLVTNAITSERTDQDYMFHSKNRPQLDMLLKNLRHAAFQWSGWSSKDVTNTVGVARKYLGDPDRIISGSDRQMLQRAVQFGDQALHQMAWQAMAESKEIALSIENFPSDLKAIWALTAEEHRDPMLMGATHVSQTQAEVEKQVYASDPFYCLKRPRGHEVWRAHAQSFSVEPGETTSVESLSSRAVPKSTYDSNYVGQQIYRSKPRMRSNSQLGLAHALQSSPEVQVQCLKSALKSTSDRLPPKPESFDAISKPRLVGTSSAKLSYLMDRVMELQQEEKVLIFYEANHIAWYIAQALEILKVEHLIYANGLKVETRSKYLKEFNNGDVVRVMLMDLKQAAHGLHVASASRVFFVNPVWNPSIEAQAIKRAHRIRSSKPVYVETLVLKGTLEDAMLRRRKAMTTQEHDAASKSPLDDYRMHDIVKYAGFIDITDQEIHDEKLQIARMKQSHQLYGREFLDRRTLEHAEETQSVGKPESKDCFDEVNVDLHSKDQKVTLTEIEPHPGSVVSEPSCMSDSSDSNGVISEHHEMNGVLRKVEPSVQPLSGKRKPTFGDDLDIQSKRARFADLKPVDVSTSSNDGSNADSNPSLDIRNDDILDEENTPKVKKTRFAFS